MEHPLKLGTFCTCKHTNSVIPCLFTSLSSFSFVSIGCVFCDPKEPIRACTRFRARILLFNIELPVTQGFPVSSHDLTDEHRSKYTALKWLVLFTFQLSVCAVQSFKLCVCVSDRQVLLHYQTVSEPATIRKLVSVLHKTSGEVLKKKPK